MLQVGLRRAPDSYPQSACRCVGWLRLQRGTHDGHLEQPQECMPSPRLPVTVAFCFPDEDRTLDHFAMAHAWTAVTAHVLERVPFELVRLFSSMRSDHGTAWMRRPRLSRPRPPANGDTSS